MECIHETWRYAVEIQSDFKGLAVLQSDAHAYFELHAEAHDIDVERPATLIVRFCDRAAAERFHSAFSGALLQL
jgi:hypothetical protein